MKTLLKFFNVTQLTILSVLVFLSLSLPAAPYYEGIGCNDEGKNCLIGWPTNRVLTWSRWGPIIELGEKCESFFSNLDKELKIIENELNLNNLFTYKKFNYSHITDPYSGGAHAIRCQIDIHSDNPNIKIYEEFGESQYWLTYKLDREQVDVCHRDPNAKKCKDNLKQQCELQRQQVLNSDLLAADIHITLDATLTQGNICHPRFISVEVN
ncbi:MAG: hypothetical protein KDD58_13705 [Bdellovibrionales bacterium]|nr:hypothetical protein [Bdellovibrionales bacterium]